MKKKVLLLLALLSFALVGCGVQNQEEEVQAANYVEAADPSVEHRTGEEIVGVSDKDYTELGEGTFYKEVEGDKTGLWRCYVIDKANVVLNEYALSIARQFYDEDCVILGVINRADNTCISIDYFGDNQLFVGNYAYDKDEPDAIELFTGESMEYIVYTDNGDIEFLGSYNIEYDE